MSPKHSGVRGFLDQVAGDRLRGISSRNTEQASGSESGDYKAFDWSQLTKLNVGSLEEERFVEVAEFEVGSQVAYVWGYGEANTRNQGRIYADIRDGNDNPIAGELQLWSDDARQKSPEGHGSWNAKELDQSISDRETWVPLPERDMPLVGEDSKLVLRFEAHEAGPGNIDATNTTVIISATEFSMG